MHKRSRARVQCQALMTCWCGLNATCASLRRDRGLTCIWLFQPKKPTVPCGDKTELRFVRGVLKKTTSDEASKDDTINAYC